MTLLMREQEIAEENFNQGLEQGVKQGIINQIRLLKEFNFSSDDIIKRIMHDYNLTEQEVRKYL